MSVLPIRVYGDPILRKTSKPVERIDDSILAFALDLLETMKDADGVGLAAVQVGRPIRMLVADAGSRHPKGASKIYINPEIVEAKGEWIFDEGCLSVPGATAEITRPEEVLVRFVDGKGKPREERYNQMLARVLQHEIDHLDGKLFIDYLNPLHRSMVLRKLRAYIKETGKAASL
ncbi:MAG: peptide deformylase [Candidatus Eisenbacteria bacterium]|nr:peptide deformylase [Candidatus Eisenbacteria bacterium]